MSEAQIMAIEKLSEELRQANEGKNTATLSATS